MQELKDELRDSISDGLPQTNDTSEAFTTRKGKPRIAALTVEQVERNWDEIRPAVVGPLALRASDEPVAAQGLLQAIRQKKLFCWALVAEHEDTVDILGFATTTITEDQIIGNRNVWIYTLHATKRVPSEYWVGWLKAFRKWCKAVSCARMFAYSRVPRVLDIAQALGGDVETRVLVLEAVDDE